jgi:hypothetical protein
VIDLEAGSARTVEEQPHAATAGLGCSDVSLAQDLDHAFHAVLIQRRQLRLIPSLRSEWCG